VTDSAFVERYLVLGLRLGRYLDGLVDAYYGPVELAQRVDDEPVPELGALLYDANELILELDAGGGPDEVQRRRWLRAQLAGMHTTARKLSGEVVRYVDEVEQCYGVRPRMADEEAIAAAHQRLDELLPGTGALADRYATWRESQAVPPHLLEPALHSLADDLRERTQRAFGLPDGERVEFALVTDKPWSGFNHYLGDLRSLVEINTDLPVLSPTLGHLVAHEAYPGHHTEHSRKEVGLVRRQQRLEETIFLVGTPQCLIAEGLADLGLEVLVGERPEAMMVEHLAPLGIPYDAEVVAATGEISELLGAVRGNAAMLLHEVGRTPDEVVDYLAHWALAPRARAEKAVQFLTDPTWRAYISCYVEGLPLCRHFVAGDPARFERLLTEQLVPADLADAA
jgi:hypothetical protein